MNVQIEYTPINTTTQLPKWTKNRSGAVYTELLMKRKRPPPRLLPNVLFVHNCHCLVMIVASIAKVLQCCQMKAPLLVSSGCVLLVALALMSTRETWEKLSETPCLLRNNYLLMEATRPLTECHLCRHIDGPIIFRKAPSQREFAQVAYSSRPVLVKAAAGIVQSSDFYRIHVNPSQFETV